MAVYTRNNIVTNGLVLYLDASNRMSYTSGSTRWNSIIGTGSFIIQTTSTSTSSFQPNPDAIYVFQPTPSGPSTSLNITGSFTFNENQSIEFWYKTATTASGNSLQFESPGMIQIGLYNQNASLTLWDWSQNTPGSHRIITYVNNGATWSHTIQSTSAYSDAIWVNRYHHIVMNFSGSAGKWNRYNLYIDTVLQATINFTIPFPSSSIGGGNQLYAPGANGGKASNSYGLIRVYNKELSIEEITQNYNASKTRFGLT
jgi:hypothetical protein